MTIETGLLIEASHCYAYEQFPQNKAGAKINWILLGSCLI